MSIRELFQGFADRIGSEARRRLQLRAQWQDLPQQWILGVALGHPRHEPAWNPQGKARRCHPRRRQQRGIEFQFPQQFPWIGNRPGQFPLPARNLTRQGLCRYHNQLL